MNEIFTVNFLINFFIITIILFLWQVFVPLRRIYCNDEGWQPIETVPDTPSDQILLTDGHIVYATRLIEFNRHGKCSFGYYGRIATHWRYLPNPPK